MSLMVITLGETSFIYHFNILVLDLLTKTVLVGPVYAGIPNHLMLPQSIFRIQCQL